MIRWYDYIVVFFYADFMTGFLLMGFAATTWYTPIIAGLIVGCLWTSWTDFYCQWRLSQETKND